MFNEIHQHNNENPIMLVFAKSSVVQAYPCSRRRSKLVDYDGNAGTPDDKFYIPFDPEARLNTELNNIRHTGMNGFTQSFVGDWLTDRKILSLTVGGYNFRISAADLLTDVTAININKLGESIIAKLRESEGNYSDVDKIYVNIKLEEVPLYTRDDKALEYRTWVLRNQSKSSYGLSTLDLPKTGTAVDVLNPENYYFSGLSFSVEPITEDTSTRSERHIPSVEQSDGSKTLAQHEISMCLFNKNDEGEWQLYEPSKLPRVEHGEAEDSVEVGHLNAQSIRFKEHPVAVYDVNKVGTNLYQLHLYEAVD